MCDIGRYICIVGVEECVLVWEYVIGVLVLLRRVFFLSVRRLGIYFDVFDDFFRFFLFCWVIFFVG